MNSDTDNKEKQLVTLLTKSDEEAFCTLYAMYKRRLINFSMRFVKSKEFAEDIYQDTFTALWQTRFFLNPEIPISSYLYTIARNRILNILRDLSPESELHDVILSQSIDHSEDTLGKITSNELKEIIFRAVNKLTKRQREVFEMSRYQGMSHKEIAHSLNISVHTVHEHISLALKNIQSTIQQKYGVCGVVLATTIIAFIK